MADSMLVGFLRAIIHCGDDEGRVIDDFTEHDFEKTSGEAAAELVERFEEECSDAIDAHQDATGHSHERVGHFLLYSLAGHGRGFWEFDDAASRELQVWCDSQGLDTGELTPFVDELTFGRDALFLNL